MQIQTVEDAIEAYTAQDAWQFADREAAWKWMFEAGQKAERNECYRLAMTASEPTKGGSFNDGKWAVADAIKMRSARCDCVTCDRDKIIAQQARIEQLTNFIKHAQVSSGVCCCGDSMEGHPSPMTCGHSPVDMWDYHSGELLEAYPDDLSALRAHDEKLRAVFQAGAASRDASG